MQGKFPQDCDGFAIGSIAVPAICSGCRQQGFSGAEASSTIIRHHHACAIWLQDSHFLFAYIFAVPRRLNKIFYNTNIPEWHFTGKNVLLVHKPTAIEYSVHKLGLPRQLPLKVCQFPIW